MASFDIDDSTLWVSDSQQRLAVFVTDQLKSLHNTHLRKENLTFWISNDDILLFIVKSYARACPDVSINLLMHSNATGQRKAVAENPSQVANISFRGYVEDENIDVFLLSTDLLTCVPPVDSRLLHSYLEVLQTVPERIFAVFSGECCEASCYEAVMSRQDNQLKEKYPKVLYCDIFACGTLKYLISQHILISQISNHELLRNHVENSNSYHYRMILTGSTALSCKIKVPDFIRREISAHIASHVYSVTEPSFFAGSRVLLFSPHPDDDVIAAGLGLQHLGAQGAVVHVAYCVTGYHSVRDEYLEHIPEDPLDLRIEKAKVREREAQNALALIGVPTKRIHFLRLPFYNNDHCLKRAYDQSDVRIVTNLLKEIRPDHIFLAGDLADPHRTHEACYNIIKDALETSSPKLYQQLHSGSISQELLGYVSDDKAHPKLTIDDIQSAIHGPMNFLQCRAIQPYSVVRTIRNAISAITQTDIPILWLYRGSWNRFTLGEASLIICGIYDEVYKKECAIRAHISQMGEAMFMGKDTRSFDVRAHELCTEAAIQLSSFMPSTAYGAEYYACSLILL